ncbi:MAG: hypothetical protein H7318_17885 [Oligoflexus sp.]|nr:hypothetical protein [Oligoflexus sp.]
MKAQDLVLAIAIVSEEGEWTQSSLAESLQLQQGEISKSLKRLSEAGLYNVALKRVVRSSLYDVLAYGVKHFFPAKLGRFSKGIPAAWTVLGGIADKDSPVWEVSSSYPVLSEVQSGRVLVPMHKSAMLLANANLSARNLLAAADSIRAGKSREILLGREVLQKQLIAQA